MRKRTLIATGGAVAALAGLGASSAMAAPPDRATDPFVCPVLKISDQAFHNSGKFNEIGDGTYTFAPGNAGDADMFNGNVPNHSTNAEGEGSPTPSDHASPGDTDYTAIWSGNPPPEQ
jgi:hypothetical protein